MSGWLGTELWLGTGIVALIILRIYKSVIVQDLPNTDTKTGLAMYRTLQRLVICIAITSGIVAAPSLEQIWWKPEIYASVVAFLWWLSTLDTVHNHTELKEQSTVLIGISTIVASYIGLVAWNLLPPPLEFVFWFRALPQEWQSITAIVVGLLVAALVHYIIIPVTHRLTNKTDTALDDSIIHIVHWPLSVSVALIGVSHAINHSLLSDFWVFGLHGISLSILIAMWTHVALQTSTIVLEHLLASKNKWLFVNDRTLPIFHLLIRIAVITMSIYLLMLSWSIDVMLWITSAGVIGIAIAYASQDTLSSLFAGVAILSDAPYKLHDFLVIDEQTKGRVTHIGFRSTRLLTTENVEVIIPNSIMANAQIINMSGGETSIARIEIAAGVAYGSDIVKVRALLLEVANNLDDVILDQPALQPLVHFVNMGASSLDFTLRLWIQNPERLLKIQDQANTLIYTTFTENGIEIPYAKQDVYLYSMDKPNT